MTEETALRIAGLGKRYGRAWALRDCTLRLPTGRIAALVGPNGAGKTTLLHLAVGLLRPDEGEVRVFGRDPRAGRETLAGIGFVAQDTPLYRDFRAAELIKLGGRLNRNWDAALAQQRLTALDIPTDRPVGKLSGGQRAQVALALALAKRPRLLLLDEPIASLDPLARHEFMQTLMGSVGETDTTVLLSSHLLADLERACDFLIVLQKAHVQLSGDVDELLARHKTLIGPRETEAGAVAGTSTVIRASRTERQSTLLVRLPGALPALAEGWRAMDVNLEDLVLAYLTAGAGAKTETVGELAAK
ncbi:MAG TPA: ABC transporter ATP-binding protein [Actinospica sp.]|nr:ABC transporter ATP-binding protein [Actinospica sp.]